MNARHIAIAAVSAALLSMTCAKAQTVIQMTEIEEGKYMVDATLNGVGVKTYFVPETWFASVSSTTYLFLYENGYIEDADVKGMTTVKMPDGSTNKAGSFVIRNLRMGNVIVKDLPAFVIKKQSVPLLIGNSAFDCFGDLSIDDAKLTINDADVVIDNIQDAALAYTDSLKVTAQQYLDDKNYKGAADCFEALMEVEELSMFNEYQYIVVLNLLSRNDETIEHSMNWMKENGGKSLTLDYWIYDGLGDSYARKNDHDKAIEYYEIAVQTYYDMFSTTEADVRRSNFQDETLGYTLYDLSRQYSFKNNLKKAKSLCSLAAKCGNAAAKEFCDKYKVKY